MEKRQRSSLNRQHPTGFAEERMKEIENCLDSQLWHACAGGMVQMPLVNSLVYYSPQGHSEHAKSSVEFDNSIKIPPMILCRVISVKYKADSDTDEVFTEITMVPVKPHELDYDEDEGISLGINRSEMQEKPVYFAKTLTQSDANNGGGFSVPRYCAETIFPRLDYSATPPVQIVLVKDLHGKIWKFRHIYRGTPRRHLLTTGWSNFVNEKKLVAGDSVVFLRTDNGDLCVGIRRAKVDHDLSAGWNHKNCTFGGFGVYLREGDKRLIRDNSDPNSKGKGKLKVDSVMDAATLAASGLPFEVVYYPRATAPEFVVKASVVRAAMRVQWCSGMRFKMAFETEDSSRISWFMGTISSVQLADPIRWPGSPWRLLEVTWDEPDLLQNVKRVNPWLVELVSNMSAIHLEPFSPLRKKHRITQHLDSPFDLQISSQPFLGNPLISSLLDGTIPAASIQGARHIQHSTSLPELHYRKLQPGLFYSGIHCFATPPIIPTGLIPPKSPIYEDDSKLLAIGCPPQSARNESKKESKANKPQLILFGKQIFTEPQLSLSLNSSLDMNSDKMVNYSDRSDSGIHQNGNGDSSPSDDRLPWHWDLKANDISPEIVQCKVFMESEDIGRTLDLSAFDSYEEMYRRLTNMFGIEISELTSRIIYRDTAGAVKHPEDEPFAKFMKVARRLTISMDSSCNNMGK